VPADLWEEVRRVLREAHMRNAKSIGGQVICACGAPQGGSRACIAWRLIQEARDEALDLRHEAGLPEEPIGDYA
jgi:hypothetical protein